MKDFKEQEIGDDEIRILGKKPKFSSKTKKIIAIVLAIVLLVGIFLVLFLTKFGENDDLEDEYVISTEEITTDNSDNSGNSTVSMVDTVLVDTAGVSVSLRIFTPMNATMDLFVGEIDTNDNNILLAIQAAEIRADNDSILGDFVLNGDLLAEGKTRKGFCALIDGQAIIGVGEGNTYLDKAIESDGDYFRQYPLVSNGCQVSNKPQNIKILENKINTITSQIRKYQKTEIKDYQIKTKLLYQLTQMDVSDAESLLLLLEKDGITDITSYNRIILKNILQNFRSV